MFRSTAVCANTYLTASKGSAPITVIRSEFWRDPSRLVRYKMLYFTLGLDSQALRRTAVIVADKKRLKNADPKKNVTGQTKTLDPTGFRRARAMQLQTWHRRVQYQEYYLQHMFTRHVWGLLRMYPPGGAKIAGIADKGYFGYDKMGHHRYTREPLPAYAAHLYERRRY